MRYHLVAVGDIGLNLVMLVSWEWNPEVGFLVLHLINDTIYLQGEQARAMWLLLDTIATLHLGQHQKQQTSNNQPDTPEAAGA